jgi:hypothetical protein
VLLLGLLEGVAYIWEREQAAGPFAWELVASRRIDYVEHASPGAGYTLMHPGAHYEYRGITVDINSHGLRGPEVDYQKPSGTFRILNLGDSVAMGWGVSEAASYGRQLEVSLNAVAGSERRYEVINAGVPGWNPENELAYLQTEGFKYHPDLIVLDCTLVNDIFGGNAVGAHARGPLIEWLQAHTYVWPFLTVEFQWLKARLAGHDRIPVIDPHTHRRVISRSTARRLAGPNIWADSGTSSRPRQRSVSRCSSFCSRSNIKSLTRRFRISPSDR